MYAAADVARLGIRRVRHEQTRGNVVTAADYTRQPVPERKRRKPGSDRHRGVLRIDKRVGATRNDSLKGRFHVPGDRSRCVSFARQSALLPSGFWFQTIAFPNKASASTRTAHPLHAGHHLAEDLRCLASQCRRR